MSINAYWLANLVYDYLIYAFVFLIVMGIIKGLDIASLTDGNAFAATFMLFIFYGLSYIPLTYILSFYYKNYASAQATYYFITFLAGGLLPLITFFLRSLGRQSNRLGRIIAWILRIFPPFAFGEGLLN
jgi:ATP-binding cassette subfamily A (ABC1) protein 3